MAKKPNDDDDDDDLSDFDFSDDDDFDFDDEDDFFADTDEEEETSSEENLSSNDSVQDNNETEPFEESSGHHANEMEEFAKKPSTKQIAEDVVISPDQIPITVAIEIAQIEIPINQLLKLEPGNMIELNKKIATIVNLSVNGKIVGKGELIQIGDVLGVRLLQLGQKETNDPLIT